MFRIRRAMVVLLVWASGEGGSSTAAGEAADALAPARATPSEAPTGFTGNNGFVDDATQAADREIFDEVEQVDEGLGPVYNAQACRECHQSPVSGAGSQVTELRVGHLDRFGRFASPTIPLGDGSESIAGRSLVNDRSVCPNADFPEIDAAEHVPRGERIQAQRLSLSVLGDGFVEAIPSDSLVALAAEQCRRSRGKICGQAVLVPVLEAPGAQRVGRFGWKAQHASLLSFSADAYLNEMGITSRLLPDEVTTRCDAIDDPEDEVGADGLADIDRFARFMRSLPAPPRDAAVAAEPDAIAGEALFRAIGCETCHVQTHVTAPAGSVVNGGALVVPAALGDKRIHPYSDFLLHDVDTGDGIVQNGGEGSARKLRTPALWGLRLRPRLMHDGGSVGAEAAILRHGGEAAGAAFRYRKLRRDEQRELLRFLASL